MWRVVRPTYSVLAESLRSASLFTNQHHFSHLPPTTASAVPSTRRFTFCFQARKRAIPILVSAPFIGHRVQSELFEASRDRLYSSAATPEDEECLVQRV
ncbi:unnamed protein product [Cercospora beticola]|nr:unnamed protein product [Cercospora beticola]